MGLKIEAEDLAVKLSQVVDLAIYPSSITSVQDAIFFLGCADQKKRLGAICIGQIDIEGERYHGTVDGNEVIIGVGLLTSTNAAVLRKELPWLCPVPLGLETSAGFGDRLGLATPGHARAARRFSEITPIFAQQSVRSLMCA